jgi:hypothetical protein
MPRGGKRPGAGRPLGKRSAHHKLAQDQARTVLAEVDSVALWKKFLHCPQVKVAADCLQYLTDRAFGRPAQTIQGGSVPVKIEFSFGAPLPPGCQRKWSHERCPNSKPGRLLASKSISYGESLLGLKTKTRINVNWTLLDVTGHVTEP